MISNFVYFAKRCAALLAVSLSVFSIQFGGPLRAAHLVHLPNSNSKAALFDDGTLNLRDFGAVGDGVTDDGPALQLALDALQTQGGGTLYIPPGHYAIVTPVSKNFSASNSVTVQGEPSATPIDVAGNGRGLNLQSELLIKVGETNVALNLSGSASLHIQDIAFVGDPQVASDALIVLALTDIPDASIQHSEFYGLASLRAGGSIIAARRDGLTMDQVAVLGCTTSSGNGTSVVQNFTWKKVSISNSKFIDYGNRPGFWGKTPLAPAYSWIDIGDAATLQANSLKREATVEHIFLDEGAFIGLSANPARFSGSSSAVSVYVSRLRMNVSNLGSSGLLFTGLDKVLIDQSYLGWSHFASSAITLNRVNTAILDRVTCDASANTIRADAQSGRLVVINSTYETLDSSAGYTRVFTTEDPLNDPEQYVMQQYVDQLTRPTDLPGVFYWSTRLERCELDDVCGTEVRADLASYLARGPVQDFTLSGSVLDEDGSPLSGATVRLAEFGISIQTQADGRYSFGPMPTAGTYTLTASKSHYQFPPQSVVTPANDETRDFNGAIDRFAISGQILNQYGSPVSFARVTLSGAQSSSTETDEQGNYAFPYLAAGGNYTISATRSNYDFAGTSRSVNDLSADQLINIEGRLLSYTISGRVTTSTNLPIAGATVTLSGSSDSAALTDSSGNYSFAVPGDGTYTITVTRTNYDFSGTSRTVDDLSANEQINIQGRLLNYTISGTATALPTGLPIAGATVTLSGSSFATAQTDSNGDYSFAVAPEGNYTVHIARPNYTFIVDTQSLQNLSANETIDFSGRLLNYTISGSVTANDASSVAGVSIQLTGSVNRSVVTDSGGTYSFTVPAEGNYTLTASKRYYEFTPPTFEFTNLAANASGNFTQRAHDVVQFSNLNFATAEDAGAVQITVTRSGDTSSNASVAYDMSDGTANQTQDYTLTAGRLEFGPGETTKTFPILITADAFSGEPQETVNLRLTSASGLLLGATNTATLTIVDRNMTPPTTNPIEDSRTLVTNQYADFLGRLPDSGGLDYWTTQITSCGSDPNCVLSRRVGVSAAFFVESEFQERGGFVYRVIKSISGIRPDYYQFIEETGHLASYGDSSDASQSYAEEFVARPEFTTIFPDSLTRPEFIDSLITRVRQNTGIDLSSERESLLADYSANDNRGRVLRLVVNNTQLQQAEYNQAFVLMQYFGYLRRNPDQGGYDFWLNVLNNRQPGNFRGMVCSFLTSREFQERFSSIVPRSNQDCAGLQ